MGSKSLGAQLPLSEPSISSLGLHLTWTHEYLSGDQTERIQQSRCSLNPLCKQKEFPRKRPSRVNTQVYVPTFDSSRVHTRCVQNVKSCVTRGRYAHSSPSGTQGVTPSVWTRRLLDRWWCSSGGGRTMFGGRDLRAMLYPPNRPRKMSTGRSRH